MKRALALSLLQLCIAIVISSAIEAKVDGSNVDSECLVADGSCSAEGMYKTEEQVQGTANDTRDEMEDFPINNNTEDDNESEEEEFIYEEELGDDEAWEDFDDPEYGYDDNFDSEMDNEYSNGHDEGINIYANDSEDELGTFFQPYAIDDITDDMFDVFPDTEHEGLMWFRTPFGLNQIVQTSKKELFDATVELIEATKLYMMEHVLVEDRFESVRNSCRMRNEMCAQWAAEGECDANPNFMHKDCAPACQTCDNMGPQSHCEWDPTERPNAWLDPKDPVTGDQTLNAMFERLVSDPWFQEMFHPVVHSRDPWAVTLESFLTDEECEELIQMGSKSGYKRSGASSGEELPDGSVGTITSKSRTSHNTWCDKVNGCYESEVAQRVLQRIYNVTNVPIDNYEHLQLLKYDVGQFYEQHHDYFEEHRDLKPGVRILTVFLYLNDVEGGGGTRFPYGGFTIQPRRGRALLWPSVLHDAPHDMDERTDHEALPVTKGVKYAANAWVHQRKFIDAYEEGCI